MSVTATAPLILVVGMHRSGTSLLGSLLQALGVSLAGAQGELIAADHHNPEGYYEWRQVVEIQERLLIDLDRWWPSHKGSLPLPPDWLQAPATQLARSQLRGLLLPERDHQRGPWAIKDPRTSRLLPLWLDLAHELAIPLRLLLAVRDPAEVASSLLQRDGEITGMDLARAQQLWWRHNLEPIHAAPADQPPPVMDFDRWFDQPEVQLDQLLAALPEIQATPQQRAKALQRIRPAHRRSLAAAGSLPLNPAVRRLHRLLVQPGRRRWPAAEPPQALRRAAGMPPAAAALAANPALWPQWLERWRHHPAPRHAGPAKLTGDAAISLCGLPVQAWQPHLWLDRLPIADLGVRPLRADPIEPHRVRFGPPAEGNAALAATPEPGALERIALNLELPPLERSQHWLTHLREQQAIWDPDPARVWLLRALGLPAHWIDPSMAANGWLRQPAAADPSAWARHLGLAPLTPGDCLVLGPGSPAWDRDLAQEMRASSGAVLPPIAYAPGWPELLTPSAEAALARAGWLAAAASRASRLVWLSPGEEALDPLLAANQAQRRLPLRPDSQITPAALRNLLADPPSVALAEDRASPPCDVCFRWELPQRPAAAVVLSLFNYGDRIAAALDSVAAQSQQQLELIVVDDASTDDGLAVAQTWMATHAQADHHPFVRLLLLRHCRNAGLAAARNSAFAAAQAPWCFVLDADNALFPNALADCLQLARNGADDLAVVHPLLAVEAEPGRPDEQRTLVRPQSWQRERFRFENHVDAMALVRRSAWEAVGGYTHIEGGWEDYDFWCKLIDGGFHGLQCPRLLAVYRTHADSMSHQATNHRWRALSLALQQRHPWLDLPLAR